MPVLKTKSLRETQLFAKEFIDSLLKSRTERKKALVCAFSGDLGSGKTSFIQGILRFFKVRRATSPTFVIMKHYGLKKAVASVKDIYHIDAYRLKSLKELQTLGFFEILRSKQSLVLIEWPGRIRKGLPEDIIKIDFCCGEKEKERIISFPKIHA